VALSTTDKRWIRKMVRDEIRALLEDMLEGQQAAMGGYDGATEVVDDDWAEEGKRKRRVGFRVR
jgi:hypothetical protein